MHSLLVNSYNEIKITPCSSRNKELPDDTVSSRGTRKAFYLLLISDIKRLVLKLFCLTVQ